MSELEFSFEPTPWERALETLTPGQAMSAAAILTLLEDASDEEVEDSFRDLLDRGISIDLSDLPGTGDGGQAAVRLRRMRPGVPSAGVPRSVLCSPLFCPIPSRRGAGCFPRFPLTAPGSIRL